MGRTNVRVRGRMFAAALLAAGMAVGPAAVPAAADGSIRKDQWHLDAMHAPEMWQISKGQGITVAVIEGGFKLDHPDLVGQLLPGKDFSGLPGGVGSYSNGHGTQMASLIAGSGKGMGGNGAYGLAPGAKILPLKIQNGSDGSGLSSADFLDQIGQAVSYAADQGAKVINISQGIEAIKTSPDDVAKLNRVIASATAKGSLVVSSVGNSAQQGNPVEYPGGLPNVVGVGAVDRNGEVTSESERGPQVDLVAPGAEMVEACTGQTGYCDSHGTSDATALVSASAALVWSVHPDWTANQVLRVLISSAGKPSDGSVRADNVGFGAVRPRIALTAPGDPGPANVNPIPEKPAEAPAASSSATPSTSPSAAVSSPASAVASPAPAGAPAASPVAQPVAARDSGSSLPVVAAAAVVGGLVLVAGVVFFVLRRRSAPSREGAVVPQMPQQTGPGVPPAPPAYEPPAPPSDNPYAR
ncbi:S8 family serine peptidase [Kitasatospora sp. NBC_00085]|uniref:S8 family serine peptidase n=1 Tax=unclassified Kitasatospora TaxID=2633591 RepID=UPI003251D37F